MTQVGAYWAKTHLADILKRVQKGEIFQITQRGQLVAEIKAPEGQQRSNEAFLKLLDLLEHDPIGTHEEVIKWKNEGHK
jgi:antitoxin (DNA-binding transcriptional repressor) of toxin-antitoxin stability system